MNNKDGFIQSVFDSVYAMAEHSNDPDTHMGAVIITPDLDRGLCSGYNHFPPRVKITSEILARPEKYLWVIHAEVTAIGNAARYGTALGDCHLFTNGLPCSECAKAIISSGIASIYIDDEWDKFGDPDYQKTWEEKHRVSKVMFERANIPIIPITLIKKNNRFKRGQRF